VIDVEQTHTKDCFRLIQHGLTVIADK
jgi:hypothetical protein